MIFEIDDSAIIEIDSPARTWTEQTYRKQDGHFAVAFGQCFGQNWIYLTKPDPTMRVDGVWVEIFTYMRRGTGEYMHLSYNAWASQRQLEDYDYFLRSGDFHRQGNLFADIKFLISEADITTRQQEVMLEGGSYGCVTPRQSCVQLDVGFPFFSTHQCISVTRVVSSNYCESCEHTLY